MESDGAAAASLVFDRAKSEGIAFTPVTGISRSADVGSALIHGKHGLALRLTRSEFESGGLAGRLQAFLATHKLAPKDIDLILDQGAIEDLVVEGIQAMAEAFLASIPDHRSWNTLTLSGCAFPLSMKVVDRQSHVFVERMEWLAWRDNLYSRRADIERLPTFSDCAIQHPKGVEGFDPRMMQVSASVRYATADSWLLIKGESTRRTPAIIQFPELATQLVYGHLKPHFLGDKHCEGCLGIRKSADGVPKLGSAEVWRRLGTIHHISKTAQSLGELHLS